jgi:signal transduction histidine kinase/ActR/RegA family two-component response regulator/PAS domain-containing protein
LGGGTKRDFGPCGDVLDRNTPLLFTHWERRYPYLLDATPLAEEGLLVPFHVQGKAVGTVWISAHDSERKFDTEDLRLLDSLARFASAAYQAVETRGALEERRAALNVLEDAVQSREAAEESNRKLRQEIDQRQRVEEALLESERRLSAEAEALAKLNELSSRLWRCRNLHEGLDEMLGAVIELLGADQGCVQLLNDDGILTIDAQRGFELQFPEMFQHVSAEHDSACGRALRTGRQVIIDDVETDAAYGRLRSIARAAGYRAVIATPLLAGDGTLQGMLSTHFSSAHRPGEQELRRLDLYVRQAGDFIYRCKTEAALRESEEALREADRLKDEFLALLGHELRNPLAPIYNASELLSRTLIENPKAQASVALIKRQTRQLTRLVDDLLDVARITQGHIELRREIVDLSSVVAQGVETVEPLLREKQHQVSIVSSFRPLYVCGDGARLAQCVSNLMSNAVKYTDPGGRIRVEIRAEGGSAVIEVADTGCGISAQLMPRIFDLFVQGDRALDRAQGGLGIGLPVVKKLVEMQGGTVRARSAGAGKGSTFEIRLPQSTPQQDPVREDETASVPAVRIFIVDDNADAADSLAALLQLDGHEVMTVRSSKEALEGIESFKPDVALLDIGLPEMNGYELLRRLRALPALRKVRFIAITGYGQAEDRERVREAGFEAHLVKPVNMTALAHALHGSADSGVTGELSRSRAAISAAE